MLTMVLFYCLKRIKIASKRGTWKWQIFISLRLKKSILGSSIIYYLTTIGDTPSNTSGLMPFVSMKVQVPLGVMMVAGPMPL